MRDCERNATSIYGASMGRKSDNIPHDTTAKLRLYRVRLDQGGYDPGGAYWGKGASLYCAEYDTEETTVIKYFRAHDREDAKANFPNARFYR